MHFGRISMSFLAAFSVCIVLVVSAAPDTSTKQTKSSRAPSSTRAPYLSTKTPTGLTKAPAPTPFSEPLFWNQLGGTINGPGAYNDHLGGAVDTSADGRIVAYGTRLDDTCEGGDNAGTVRVSYYDSEENKWMQLGQTLYGEEEEDSFGKNVKLSADGHTLAVSAKGDESVSGKGYVEVYQYKEKSNKWKPLGKRIVGEFEYEEIGWGLSLSADGKTVAVGSAYHSPSDYILDTGQTRIFRLIESEWEQLGDSIYGEEEYSYDGFSVDLSADGKRVVIGGPGAYDSNQFPRARVFRYKKEIMEWIQVGDDLVGKTKDGEMGLAVSISGDGKTVAVSAGCYYYCGSTPDNDRIKVYKLKAGEWKKVGESIYREDNEFSFAKTISLSEDGSTVALTAMRGSEYEYYSRVGLAKVYNLVDGNKWKKLGQSVLFHPVNRNPSYSNIIALSANGRALVVGSSEKEKSNVKVFELGSYRETPNPTHYPTSSTRAPVAAPSTKAPTPTRSPRPSLQPKYWMRKGKVPKALPGFRNTGSAVASSKDGNTVAFYSRFWDEETYKYSGTVMVYNFKSDKNKWKLMGNIFYGIHHNFGTSLALSAEGDHLAIGSEGYDGGRGRVNIYRFRKGDWVQLGESLIGKCRQDKHGWALSLSDNGKTIAVGGYDGDKNTDDDGSANNSEQGYTVIYKFKGKSNKWKPLGEAIYGSGPDEEDGTSVDLSGDGKTVVIGGPFFGKGYLGRVRVFKLINKKWEQVGKDIIGEVGSGEYGISVSMSNNGNIIAVGSGCEYYCGTYAGHVDVLKINSKKTKWKQLGNRISALPYDDKDFGNNVSLSDDGKTVAIGAIAEYGDMNAKVFQLNNNKWDQVGQTIYGEGRDYSYSPRHVALSGDARTLVIGDRRANEVTVYSVDYDPV